MNEYTLTPEAKKRAREARKQGIMSARNSAIVRIVLNQEIVSYCTHKGCISFDIGDVQGGA